MQSKCYYQTNRELFLDTITNFVCKLKVHLPKGSTALEEGYSVPSSIDLVLLLRNGKYPYFSSSYFFKDKDPDVKAITYSCSHLGHYRLPEGTVIGFSDLTEVGLNDCLKYAHRVELINKYNPVPDSDEWIVETQGYDMSRVVSELHKRGLVKVRYTDHEFRDDERNLQWVKDWDLDGEYPVDEMLESSDLGQHLVQLLEA